MNALKWLTCCVLVVLLAAGGAWAGRPTFTNSKQAEIELQSLRLRYTDNHPDIVWIKAVIKRLKAEEMEKAEKRRELRRRAPKAVKRPAPVAPMVERPVAAPRPKRIREPVKPPPKKPKAAIRAFSPRKAKRPAITPEQREKEREHLRRALAADGITID